MYANRMEPTSPSGYERAEFAEFYDHVVPYRTRPDVEFYVEAALESGGPVLELGCGTGRVLIPTARAGVEITGLDASVPMLDLCRERLEQETDDVRNRVDLIQSTMQDFGLDRKYRLVTTPFRPFQHLLTVEDQMRCLRQAHAHLYENGTFILDVYNPWLEKFVEPLGVEKDPEPEFTMPDGRRVVRKHRTLARDLFNQINDEELIYYVKAVDGSEKRMANTFRMRYLYRFEAEHLLARCGFEVEQVYAGYDKSPYGSTYPGELIMVSKKV